MARFTPKPLALALFLVSVGAHGQSQQGNPISHTLNVGAYFAQGDYGEPTDTEILYLPLSYQANIGKWGFQVLVPHLSVTGTGNVLVNIGGVTRAVAGTEEATQRGLGDTVASVSYQLDPWSDRAPFIDLRLDVKLPTADENKSLGTGEVDYSVQADFSRNWGSNVLFATVGYNFRGESELFTGLEDSAFAQLGFATPVNERVNIGAFYDYRERASLFSAESHELLPYFTWQVTPDWSVTGLLSWGFTDASADTAVQVQLSYRW